MMVLKNIQVPTGNILIMSGEKGRLECLSLGDYGQGVNLNQHKRVDHTDLLPLDEKWVCTISTQYGCSMGCQFCDVPNVGPGTNASLGDIVGQVKAVRMLHPEITNTERFNIHYARMGEPSWNSNVIKSAEIWPFALPEFHVHPVVSTMMPRYNKMVDVFIREWCHVKNDIYHGEAGLQLSINSTNESEREAMFNGNAMELQDIAFLMDSMPAPSGRKYTLNFAIAGYTIDAGLLARLFPPSRFVCKLTPMHKTTAALTNGIETDGDYTEQYPYDNDEANLKKAGFDVLVFIASKEEDESRITCGNAILSDSEVFG